MPDDNKVKVRIPKLFADLFGNVYNFFGFYGGRAGGKSYSVADTILVKCRLENLKVVIIRETKESLDKSIKALYVLRINKYEFSDYQHTANRIWNTITGSEILFIGMNDSQDAFIDSIRSIPEIDIAIIEEAQNISQKALDVLIPTVRRNERGSKIIAIWNPKTKKDPIWQYIQKPTKRMKIQKINYTDNIYCPLETKEEAEMYRENRPEDYKHIWLGEPKDQSDNRVIKYFSEENIQELNYQADLPLHITCDFNVDPMCWALAHKIDDTVYYIDELAIENTNTRECVEEFLRRYGQHKAEIIINGDASGDNRNTVGQSGQSTNYQIMISMLQQAGLNVQLRIKPYNTSVARRIEVFDLRVYGYNGVRNVFVDPRCEKIIHALDTLQYKAGTSIIDTPTVKQLRDGSADKYSEHMFDAISYLTDYYYNPYTGVEKE